MNIKYVKIVCVIDVENKGFDKLFSNFDNKKLIEEFIFQTIYRFEQGGIIDILKKQEILKLSSNGVLDKNSKDWNMALISDSYDADTLVEIMKKYDLLSEYTFLLYHNKPVGLLELLDNSMELSYFVKAKGYPENAVSNVYPSIFPVLASIVQKNKEEYTLNIEKLASAIMDKDNEFLILKGNFDNMAKQEKDYTVKEISYRKIFTN